MATMPQAPDDQAPDPADPNDGAPEDQDTRQQPDGGDPDQMIGYIDPNASPKVKTYLLAAKQFMISPQGAMALKKLLATSKGDPAMPIAMLINTTIEKLQDKFGPLSDQEHDQVCAHIAGWIVSSLQKRGLPGLDDQGARQDLMGRILQASDRLTHGQPQGQDPNAAGGPQQGAPQQPPDNSGSAGPPAPMSQFAPPQGGM